VAGESAPKKPYERLNEAMEVRRLELDLNWKQLARKAGISDTALRKIRRGQNHGRPDTRYRLNKALQLEPGTLEAVFEGRIEAHEVHAARTAEPTPDDDDQPLTRGEFRLYLALCQDPHAELPDSAVKKLRALGIDPARFRRGERGGR